MSYVLPSLLPRASPFDSSPDQPAWHRVVGLTLALSSAFFIGASFVIKKRGLLDSNAEFGTRAGHGHAYLKSPMWWLGLFLSEYLVEVKDERMREIIMQYEGSEMETKSRTSGWTI
ncbi:hypothetical protein HDV00_012591 [Rhizophlyctis rosea]|nr:hypothetical protein HDV00_012591 [Rhizophlyctis rosea]